MVALDYLIVGHITKDLVDDAFTLGGTASYAARTALALGCRVGVVTSAEPELDVSPVLGDALVARISASESTTFENIYTDDGRRQLIHGVAETLTAPMVPSDWRPTVVHLGPVARECDRSLVDACPEAFVGATLQGWLRRWDRQGRIRCYDNEELVDVLRGVDAAVVSEEDVAGDRTLVERYASQARLLVLTQGAAGCIVYVDGQPRHVPVSAVSPVDPTGAGDVFAAAFFIRMQREGNPYRAARFANCIAACSVTRKGVTASAPRSAEVARCEQIVAEATFRAREQTALRRS